MAKETGKPKRKKKIIVIAAILVLLLIASLWSWYPFTETITVELAKDGAEAVRIALVTDLHSCSYGENERDLEDMIRKAEPDIVVLGGDFFDDVQPDDNSKKLAQWLSVHYPCYYVTGNHEYWSGRAGEMKAYLQELGIHVLAGDCETITVNGRILDICGVDDPDGGTDGEWKKQLDAAWEATSEGHVRILVSHRPERVEYYEQYGFDLVLCGHAHAGQFLIPFANRGILAPNQGLFPEYVNGRYDLKNGSIMIVSRGLARESTPLPRFFNHPELLIVEVK
ncbi:MAG: metallophosphoesterase [Lachnospiraceae bacterium]|nr:metallophosphoesterase [Lachnospiraceae bacterium]